MGFLDSLFGSNQAAQTADPFGGLKLPDTKEQELLYEMLQSQGTLTPEMQQLINLGPSAMDSVNTDPRLKQAQLNALSQLGEIGQNGMTLQDQSNLQKIQTQVGQQDRGAREAILQNNARRGTSGSGFELAAQLASQQASGDRAAQAGLDVAAQAQSRALEAILKGGDLSGSMRSQDFGEQSAKAQAQDAISRFNAQNSQNVQGQNVATRNTAQAANLQNRQAISAQNVALRNQQQQHNKGLIQQNFDNQIKRAGGTASINAANTNATNQQNQSNSQQQTQLIGTGITAAALFSDENLKKNIQPGKEAIRQFLDSISGYEFDYKNPEHGEGKQLGIMAQDLEKTDIGRDAVENHPEGKKVDFQKLQAAQLAQLSDINVRIKKLEGKDS